MLTWYAVKILRLLNTNVDGKQKVMYALTKIKGVGRRYCEFPRRFPSRRALHQELDADYPIANLVCKKADVDLNKRYAFPDILVIRFTARVRPAAEYGRQWQRS